MTRNYYNNRRNQGINNIPSASHVSRASDPLSQTPAISKRITFKISNNGIEGPSVNLTQLSRAYPAERFPSWVKQFELVKQANEWSTDRSLGMFLLCCDEELKDLVINCSSLSEAIQIIHRIFFPLSQFAKYRRQLESIRSTAFHGATEYLAKIRTLERLANYCIDDSECLNKREITDFFLNGLPGHLQEAATALGHLSLDDMALKLEEIEIIRAKFHNNSHNNNNNNTNYYNKKTNYDRKDNSFKKNSTREWKKKWCSFHKSTSHTDAECKAKHGSSSDHNNSILSGCTRSSKEIELPAKLSDTPVTVLLDTGASTSYINATLASNMEKTILDTSFVVQLGNGTKETITEKVQAKITFDQIPGSTYIACLYIQNGLPVDINLGRDFLWEQSADLLFSESKIRIGENTIEMPNKKALNLVINTPDETLIELVDHEPKLALTDSSTQVHEPKVATTKERTIELIEDYKKSNSVLGTIPNVKHTIEISKEPKMLKRTFRGGGDQRVLIQKELDELSKMGVIRPSKSPFASPAFTVPKPEGAVRLVVDYKEINKVTRRDHFPLPTAVEMLDQLREQRIFSKLDLRKGYHQIAMDPESIKYTSFTVPQGQFEYTRLPFGLSTAPASFQRALTNFIGDIPGIFIYLDDILIASPDENTHSQSLTELLRRLKKEDVSINFSKCSFFVTEVKFIGHIIKDSTVRADISNLNKSKLERPPSNNKELRSLIGYINWFREYIPRISELLSPLNNKLSEKKFSWDPSDAQLVLKISEEIEKQQVLHIPALNKPFKLYTDASDKGISGVLLQENNLIRLFSRKFSDVQTRYSIVEKECLAVVESLTRFRELIRQSHVDIFTDNKNITFDTLKDSNKVQRWKTLISEFDHTLNHIAGDTNRGADWLSRNCVIKEHIVTPVKFDSSPFVSDEKDHKGRLIVNENKITPFLTQLHDFLGHPGAFKMNKAVGPFFKFKSQNSRILKFSRSCLQCALQKSFAPQTGKIQGYLTAEAPNEKVSSDIFGPFSLEHFSSFGKINLITFSDIFSRFTKVFVLEESTGKEVSEIFEKNWTNQYGVPKILLSDRGPQYTSTDLKRVTDRLKITRSFSSPYNPTSNSVSERINQTIAVVLRINKGKNIMDVLPIIERSLNATNNRCLGSSPEEIFLGHSSIDPSDRKHEVDLSIVRERLSKEGTERLEKKNTRRKDATFKEGDSVFIRKRIRTKMDPMWIGPYEVVGTSKNSNQVRIDLGTRIALENIKHLKPFGKQVQDDAYTSCP